MIRKASKIGVMIVVTSAYATSIGWAGAQRESKSSGAARPVVRPLDLQQGAGQLRDLNIYRDDKFPFTILYPNDWNGVTPTNPAVRLSLVNMNREGNLNAGFSLAAVSSPELKNLTAAQKVDAINRGQDDAVDALRATSADAKVVQRGETKLGGEPAYYIIIEAQMKQGTEVKVIRFLHVTTIRAENTYHLTFSCEVGNFDSMLPVFKLIATSFKIKSST